MAKLQTWIYSQQFESLSLIQRDGKWSDTMMPMAGGCYMGCNIAAGKAAADLRADQMASPGRLLCAELLQAASEWTPNDIINHQ